MKKNILIFSHELPPMQGGAGTYVYELATGLKKIGYNVTILSGKNSESLKLKEKEVDSLFVGMGISIHRFKWINQNRLWFISWKKIFKEFLRKNKKFDHIFFANFTSLVIGHKLNLALIPSYSITLHGDDIDYCFTKKKLKSYILINRSKMGLFFNKSTQVICVSNYTQKKFNFVTKHRIPSKVIHHGVSLRIQKQVKKSKVLKTNLFKNKNDLNDKVVLIYISRFEDKKGQDKLIRLLIENSNLLSKTHTIFVGGGSTLESNKKKVKDSGLMNSVTFTGEISRIDVMKYLSLSDILINLSSHPRETFGIVLLEAMVYGIPCIALKNGGMVEVVEK
jgi:L-malate glycosyltransferase